VTARSIFGVASNRRVARMTLRAASILAGGSKQVGLSCRLVSNQGARLPMPANSEFARTSGSSSGCTHL
jgi:hypothetical protein